MFDAIPDFSWDRSVIGPWTHLFWIAVSGFLVSVSCGLVGVYLILRRMALVGDAISHSVLPGIVLAFVVFQSLAGIPIFLGALAAGLITTVLIEFLHRKSRIKQDAAIGITFTSLFAIGVIMVSLFSSHIDLDADCVLFGELGQVGLENSLEIGEYVFAPPSVLRMAGLAVFVAVIIAAFYKELLVTSFDPALAVSLGINSRLVHYSLMGLLSVVVVASFEAVGSILVIAVLILPGATAFLLTTKLPQAFALVIAHSFLSAVIGFQLANLLDCRHGAALVVAGFFLFCLAWIFSPSQGVLQKWVRRRELTPTP